jgi:hypothetical protein
MSGAVPSRALRVLGHEGEDAAQVVLALQDVDLVDGHHDLLAQSRMDSRKVRSLSVKGRSAEVTNRTRSERGSNSRVSISCSRMHGVGAGRVHDVDLAQHLNGRGDHVQAGLVGFPVDGGSVLEQADARRRRGDPLLQHALPEEGVDERALARVELAHHHEEEELVELPERAQEMFLVVRLHCRARASIVRRSASSWRSSASSCLLTLVRGSALSRAQERSTSLQSTDLIRMFSV